MREALTMLALSLFLSSSVFAGLAASPNQADACYECTFPNGKATCTPGQVNGWQSCGVITFFNTCALSGTCVGF